MISIIGAGPVGSYLASLLARGHNVKVYEEHKEVGRPIQCTGILTGSLDKVINVKDDYVVNKIKTMRIIAPNKEFIDVNFKKENYVIDRELFDKHLYFNALDKGAEFYFNRRFKDFKDSKITFNKGEEKTNLLIGADGSFSSVAKKAGLYGNRKFVTAMQYRVEMDVNKDLVELFLGHGCFGWIVPENDKIARVAVVDYRNPWNYLEKLLAKRKYRILENQSGLIPIYDPKVKTKKDNVFLVGDAATQVKATTFGGVIPGLIAAKELSKSFRNYERNWRKKIGRELWLSLIIRKKLDKFDDNKYNKLVEMFSNEKIKEIIESKDRDFPSKMIFRLLLREPRLLFI